MADKTGIEWTDATWNPVVGCTICSPGCKNCYAMKDAHRLAHAFGQKKYRGLTTLIKGKPVWNGTVRLVPDALDQPLRWRAPRKIFVNSMSDLFHEDLSFGAIMRVFQVMWACPQHTFQVLTKRPERMAEFFRRWADLTGEDGEPKLARGPAATRKAHPSGRGQLFADMLDAMGQPPPGAAYPTFDWMGGMIGYPTARVNIWLGVTAEDQLRADERREHLSAVSSLGWRTIVSYEPAIGPVDWTGWEFVRQIISGGESGPDARVHHPDWHRVTRDFCHRNSIAYYFKQWGAWVPANDLPSEQAESLELQNRYERLGDIDMVRVGKKAAGATLDRREHREFPA